MFEDVFQFLANQIQTNQLFSGAVLGGLVLGIVHSLRALPGKIIRWLSYRLTVTAYFTNQDDAYRYLRLWLNDITFGNYNRRFHVVLIGSERDRNQNTRIPKFALSPYSGFYVFRYCGKWIVLDVTKNEPSADNGSFMFFETIKVIYPGRSLQFLEDNILRPMKEKFEQEHREQVTIWINSSGGFWETGNKLRERPLSTVVLPDKQQGQDVYDDIMWFVNNEQFYQNAGIPYHRGYLLSGPPGTGKTSLIYALASELERDVFILNLASITDDKLMTLMQNDLMNDSILVIEDIDTTFTGRENVASQSATTKVNFSTLINALDGFGSPHGLIVFMTTNHPDKLDPALTRPGRVDYNVKFSYCNSYQIGELFRRFYDATEAEVKQAEYLLPADTYSPATLQGWFMTYTKEQILNRRLPVIKESA